MFFTRRTAADKEQATRLKALEKAVKQQQNAAKKAKKQQDKQRRQAQKQADKAHKRTVQLAERATKSRKKLVKKADKDKKRRLRRARLQAQRQAALDVPPFAKSSSCFVCGSQFQSALHKRRHHCRQCRQSCCLKCLSQTRRSVPEFGMEKPQKVCVVCDTLVLNTAAESGPRDPAEAIASLAANAPRRPAAYAARRPSSAPLPEEVRVTLPARRPRSMRAGGRWTLLKRKRSAEQNRKLDLDLQLEKEAMRGGRAIELQPQSVA